MTLYRQAVEAAGMVAECAGVGVIVIGLVLATYRFLVPGHHVDTYRRFREDLGRAILLGLEFLVAGDIIRTVAVDPTLESTMVLGMIVLIRTFLSFSLQVELEGRWPWQRKTDADQDQQM